jgi:hypothetical protein
MTTSITDRYPLSHTQQMWCGWPAAFNPRFVLAEALRITGRVDVGALRRALNDVVERHDVLRTVVVRDDPTPHQWVRPAGPVALAVDDLPPGTDRAAARQRLLAEAELSEVDVAELPLLRARLTRFDEGDAVLTLVTHHTAADGWSMDLLKRDLAACYAARAAGAEPTLPPVPTYGEYAVWQQEHARGPKGAAADAYWRRQLAGAQIFALPTDRPVEPVPQAPYRAHCFAVRPDVIAAIGALATATRTSTFMVLMAALNVLAHGITGTTDPAIFTMSAGRSQRAFRDTIGPFLDFLVLRTDLAGCVTFRDVLARTRSTCLAAQAHEVSQRRVEELVPNLMRPLENPRNCDFSFGFSRPVVSAAEIRIADGAVPIRQAEQQSTGAPGGLIWTMGVIHTGEALSKLQYNPNEFDQSTVEGWATTFQRVLDGAIEAPDRAWKIL